MLGREGARGRSSRLCHDRFQAGAAAPTISIHVPVSNELIYISAADGTTVYGNYLVPLVGLCLVFSIKVWLCEVRNQTLTRSKCFFCQNSVFRLLLDSARRFWQGMRSRHPLFVSTSASGKADCFLRSPSRVVKTAAAVAAVVVVVVIVVVAHVAIAVSEFLPVPTISLLLFPRAVVYYFRPCPWPLITGLAACDPLRQPTPTSAYSNRPPKQQRERSRPSDVLHRAFGPWAVGGGALSRPQTSGGGGERGYSRDYPCRRRRRCH